MNSSSTDGGLVDRAGSAARPWARNTRILASFVVGYPLLVALGYLLKSGMADPAPIWPAHAVSFTAFVLLPWRRWWIVALAIACAELLSVPIVTLFTQGASLGLWSTLGLALANICTSAGPAAAARSFRLRDAHRVTGAIASPLWMLALILGTLPGALIGTSVHAHLAGLAPAAPVVVTWMLSSMIGIVSFAPGFAMLSGLEQDRERVVISRLEYVGLAVCIVAVFFSRSLIPNVQLTRIPSLMLLAFPFVWLAARAPLRVFSGWVAVVIAAATFAMVHGLGAFQPGASLQAWQGPLFLVQVSLLSVVGVTFFVNQISIEQRELVAALKREHERLVWYARALDEAEETVRRQTASDLHDGVAQLLTGQSLILAAAERELRDHPAVESVAHARSVNREAMQDVRNMIAELSPPELGASGLAEAIDAMAGQFRARFGFEVEREVRIVRPLPKDLVTLGYRVIRELVFNSYKHSTRQSAVVSAVTTDGALRISVADDGVGFSDKDIGRREGGGFGLAHIVERVAAVRGTVEIGRSDGPGSRVVITIPIEAPPASPARDRSQ
jgi:signal transduction histidine kinase